MPFVMLHLILHSKILWILIRVLDRQECNELQNVGHDVYFYFLNQF